jgi:hypothetical protein
VPRQEDEELDEEGNPIVPENAEPTENTDLNASNENESEA